MAVAYAGQLGSCLSTDAKPDGLEVGASLHETDTKRLFVYDGTTWTGIPLALYSGRLDSTAIANTTSETDFDVVGTSIPASSMVAGSTFWIRAAGKLSTTLSPTLTLKVKFGSTALVSTAALTCNPTVTNDSWFIEGFITVRSTGAGGTIMADGNASNGRSSDSIGVAAVVTVDTTAAQVPTISATWGALSVLNTITLQSLRVVQLW